MLIFFTDVDAPAKNKKFIEQSDFFIFLLQILFTFNGNIDVVHVYNVSFHLYWSRYQFHQQSLHI